MAFCSNCGNELKEGAKFCPKCGKKVMDLQNQLSIEQFKQSWQESIFGNVDENEDDYEYEEDLSGGMKFLCFLIPLVGYGIFVFKWREEPQKAFSALGWAFISSVLFSFISLLVYWKGYMIIARIITAGSGHY